MHFEKLKISGFKSFVDQTEMLVRPGVTGLIGPNGCGKSNILEALRWAMGETSPKSLRGAGMEDVIFAGAATRPPRNFAEVALVLDNTERRAPASFNDSDRVEITRRIARDSGSTYRCNGKEIRARDAQTLFADASTGANSPALVRQGQISEIINAKPKARKRILEDAAGIAGLHGRRQEALARLNAAEANLARVAEILAQLEAREATLTREAQRAERYRTLQREIRSLEAVLAFRRWREADRERAAAEAAVAAGGTRAAKSTQAASEAARRRMALEEKTPGLREEEAIARALHQRLLIEREGLASKERAAQETAEALSRRIAQHRSDLGREAEAAEDAAASAERLAEELAALPEDDAAGEQLDGLVAAETAAAAAARAAEAALDQLTAEAARSAAERQARIREAADAEAKLDKAARDASDAADRIAELVEAAEEADALAQARAEETEEAALAAEQADAAAEQAETARAQAEAAARAARGRLAEAEGAVSALRSEIAALDKLVAAKADGDAPPVLDSVRVQPGAEAALAAAFGDALSAPELSGPAAGTGRGWRALPAEPGAASQEAQPPDGARPLSELAEAPAALSRRLRATGLVEGGADGAALQARLAPGQALVSADGDLWRWDGYVAPAGSAPSQAAAELERRNRRDAAQAQLDHADAERAALAEATEDADAAAEAAGDADGRARETRRTAAERLAAAERAASAAQADAGAARSRRESQSERANERAAEREAAAEALEMARAALETLEDGEASAAAIEVARADVEAARTQLVEAQSARSALAKEAEARAARRAALEREAAEWARRRAAAAEQRRALEDRLEEAEAELEAARAAPLEIEARRAEIEDEVGEATARLTAAVDALAAADAGLKEAARAEKEAEAALSEAREERARLEERIEASLSRAEEFGAAVEEAAGCKPDQFLQRFQLDPDELPTVKSLESDLGDLRRRRDKLGPVNLRADQELSEVTAERESLGRERGDLDAAIGKLRQGVNAINREGRERLQAAFDEVNKNFSALFTHLFDGGDAKLVLVESDDPLEAGLEIMCQPPDKRLSSLSLLSGGEQTLTAISLIFAVFMVNPAPICALDEVDAPLDDANVARFCDLLDEMKRRTNTRFLIITHHAVTMSRMDRLFGVTMVEKGVSQLVSVDLETAREMVDA